jgi:polyisoprenoid-binding protein YceI
MTTTTTAPTLVPTGTWSADPAHSNLGFAVKHMKVTTVRGRFPEFDGTLVSGEGGARIEGVIAVASATTFDETRDGHLKSPDFFDVDKHPEARFSGSFVAPDRVEGEFTLRGVAQPLTLQAKVVEGGEDPWGNERIGVHLTGSIDRTAFGVSWNAPLPGGDFLLDNRVALDIDLSLTRQEA